MEIIIGILIMGAAQICKKWIKPKWGDNGVHVFIALLAILYTGIQYFASQDPVIMVWLQQAYTLLVGCIGTYELIFRKIGDKMAQDMPQLDSEDLSGI